jgi:signal transduction histidine kinase
MPQQNNRYLILMISSILVMLVLQVFWLNSVYQDYKSSLKQETGLLLNNTVTELLDSLVWKGMSPLNITNIPGLDSVKKKKNLVFRRLEFKETSDNSSEKLNVQIDSLRSNGHGGRNMIVRIMSTDKPMQADSLRKIMRPLIMGSDSMTDQSFEFEFQKIPIDSALLTSVFNQRLQDNGYSLEAKIMDPNTSGSVQTTKIQSILYLDEINIPFGINFLVYFDDYRTYLWKKMVAPIGFALLVLVLILVSFYVLFQNALQQQRLNILKNDIISNITHELKTPVATVSVVLESLENFGADHQEQTRKEYMQIAKQELKRLSVLTERILQDAVMGIKTITREKLEFDQLVETQLAAFKPILASREVVLDYQKSPGDYLLNGDAEQLALMVFNLVDNAIKYSGDSKIIKVQLSQKGGIISFQIKDLGIGIPLKYQKAIFEKFVRVPKQNLHEVKGYGLGLAQVSAAVNAHEGKVHVLSKEGNGSLFTIDLPQR